MHDTVQWPDRQRVDFPRSNGLTCQCPIDTYPIGLEEVEADIEARHRRNALADLGKLDLAEESALYRYVAESIKGLASRWQELRKSLLK